MEKIQLKKNEMSNKRRRREEMITEIEMEAAQQLIHLSDEESNINIIKKKKTIEEIFGKDDIHDQDHQCTKEMVVLRVMSSKTKKKKYRTIESIYMATRPIRVVIR
ncbi:hypothetical protein ISN44_As11g009460 [Arabidopsis suecica]|uniref:Uncharacterized protein n=1 Tax=Arabidopsis suecica TaxID=45249 RepID=A0A8T1Z6N9_ARASU|nr:hypothetical protein ISN44_As11g009460 [Arabidopsis suecica]